MLIFTLLIALLLERTLLTDPRFDFEFHFNRWHDWLSETALGKSMGDSFARELLLIVVPTLVVFLLLEAVSGVFFGALTLVVWICVLFLCSGCAYYRRKYHQYVKASCRGDTQACEHFAEFLYYGGKISKKAKSAQDLLGQRLTWINYRFYFAVIFWAALLGPVGAVFYAACRSRALADDANSVKGLAQLKHLLHWMDWIPVRICSLGYALVGNFSRAFSIWLDRLLSPDESADVLLGDVVEAASFKFDSAVPRINKVCHQVSLAKRNIMLMLSVLAVLTIVGFLA